MSLPFLVILDNRLRLQTGGGYFLLLLKNFRAKRIVVANSHTNDKICNKSDSVMYMIPSPPYSMAKPHRREILLTTPDACPS